MKYSLQIIITLALSLYLVGCSNEEEKDEVTKEVVAEESVQEEIAEATPEAAAPEAVIPKALHSGDMKELVLEKIEEVKDAIDKSQPNWKQNLTQPELMTFDESKSYFWDMKTNKGDMSFRLYTDTAPMHATSTIFLTENGFYDDVLFHRVIPAFMAQGGDPTGTGRAGPGYNYAGEFSGGRSHDKPGILSMANAGPNTDGSQFFITFVPTPFLDGKHTIFGEIVSGTETLSTLEALGSSGSGKTKEVLKIEKATIRVE